MREYCRENQKLWWFIFVLESAGLFLGYVFSYLHHQHDTTFITTYLKGLTALQHFGIHYVVGIATGMVIISAYYWYRKKRLNEPLVLILTTFISHWPDIRFVYRRLPHEPWEVIFLFHTIADESFATFWAGVVISITLVVIYKRMIQKENMVDIYATNQSN